MKHTLRDWFRNEMIRQKGSRCRNNCFENVTIFIYSLILFSTQILRNWRAHLYNQTVALFFESYKNKYAIERSIMWNWDFWSL